MTTASKLLSQQTIAFIGDLLSFNNQDLCHIFLICNIFSHIKECKHGTSQELLWMISNTLTSGQEAIESFLQEEGLLEWVLDVLNSGKQQEK